MSLPSYLDYDRINQPISEEAPAGAIPRELRANFNEARKVRDDPERPGEKLYPNWSDLINQAQDALLQKSKDLVLASRLTEALFQRYGFAGLPDGFRVLRELMTTFWDDVNPPLDEDGAEGRASAVNWLCTTHHGASFPVTIRLRPIAKGTEASYSYWDWQQTIQEGKGDVDRADLEQALASLPYPVCQQYVTELEAGLEELDQLSTVMLEKMDEMAPDVSELKQALVDCRTLLKRLAEEKQPIEDATEEGESEETETSEGSPGGATKGVERTIQTREEAYRQLAKAAAVLERLEPHSPIPYLVKRAVALGGLPFPEMIKAFVRESSVLDDLHRELGIQSSEDD